MGRKLILTGTKVNNPSAPILPDIDVILPKSGALVFIDPSHPARPWAAGTPSPNYIVPNLAEKQAMSATGLSAEQVSPIITLSSTYLSGGNAIERSAKGGFHTILTRKTGLSATAETAAIDYQSVNGAPLSAWVGANKAHSFYVAKWGRWTRPLTAGTYSGGWNHSLLSSQNAVGCFFTRAASSGETVYGSTNRVGWESVNHLSNTAAPYFVDGAWSPASHLTSMNWNAHRANRNSFGATGGQEIHVPSDLFYGYYVEDLTISGRTYAEVNALVKAKYTRDVLTPGGRYHGDTFTNPATLP